ncbi:MAG TPA: 2-phospho-L-lactate guanylyltransferase, partial [Levilinea sp.]|nr:2-phospho-L-lactate guanylyltransferase [Levilinea sp.]
AIGGGDSGLVEKRVAMIIQAIIPVKPFDQAKSRLAQALSPAQRAACSAWMLSNTLTCLRSVEGIEMVTVVSRDAAALAIAKQHGASALLELTAGLNQALHQAAECTAPGALLLVLPADLPLLTAQDLMAFVRLQKIQSDVILAPDRHQQGSNALLVDANLNFHFCFGPSSFQKHQAEARRLGLRMCSASIFNLAFDLDTPEDLQYLWSLPSLPALLVAQLECCGFLVPKKS